MQTCERWLEVLTQYVADGEPDAPEYDALRMHVEGCVVCRARIVRLRRVESGLRALPIITPDPSLPQRIMVRVAQAEQAPLPEEPWLSWAVWVPAITLIVALGCAAMLMPPQSLPNVQWVEMERYLLEERLLLPQFAAAQEAISTPPLSLAAWSAIFSILAGLGLVLSLRSWREEHSRSLNQIEHQVLVAAHRLGNVARRAH